MIGKRWYRLVVVLLAVLAGLATGFLVKQWAFERTDGDINIIAIRQAKQDLEDEEAQNKVLQSQNFTLEDRKKTLLSGFNDDTDIGEIIAELRKNALLAGMTDVSGSGIILTLDDKLNYDPLADPIESVIHDSTINYVINLLWSSGARAIAFNGVRLTAVSEINCVGPTILCYGVRQMPPYVISAIGPLETMALAVESDSYLAHLTQKIIGVRLGIVTTEILEIPSFSRTRDFIPYIDLLWMP